jgi:alkylation response protein AidB-like acyl-CoA dehydrogenase
MGPGGRTNTIGAEDGAGIRRDHHELGACVESIDLDLEELRDSIRKRLSDDGDLQSVRKAAEHGGGINRELWADVAALGWLGLPVPEEYGGLAQSAVALGVLYEELGRHLSRLPVMSTLLAAQALASGGTAEQKALWLPQICSGALIAAIGLDPARKGAGLPVLDEHGVLDGVVRHVLFADSADALFLPLRDTHGKIGLAIVHPTQQGVAIERRAAIDLTRDLCSVTLRGVRIAGGQRIDLSAQQWDDLDNAASLALACDSVGGALHILERTVDYLCTRVQFDRPIGSFQALKHRAASWKILQEAASALARQAGATIAANEPLRASTASGAKFYACDAYAAIAGDAIQLHGGIGFTWEHECHLFFKRAKLNQVLFGDTVFHKERVAQLAFS